MVSLPQKGMNQSCVASPSIAPMRFQRLGNDGASAAAWSRVKKAA